ncbi:DUF4082 domain-containing protein [Nocardioides sp. LHG3406-4]|uniref:DUF4082 domain-containing protein n=1 Tax=Nocardioides sp. LHG3406-4 TaxID=2804575 RepID=UPI003CEC3138
MSTAVALGSVVIATITVASAPAGAQRAEATGLWSKSFAAHQTADDCGPWRLDENDFCVANDARNGLEVGVRFRTARELRVTGVRIYRADPASVRGSLWRSDGTLLARGTFPASSGNGWEDLRFADPVTVTPGETYVASYFTPGTKYAFRYGYFADSSRTVGPVTALRSTSESPNGIHCYDDAPCVSFPVNGYRSSTYWVTPIWQDTDAGPTEPGPNPPNEPPTDGPAAGQQAPRVTSSSPAAGAGRVRTGAKVTATFSRQVRRGDLTRATVRLARKGSAKAVPASLRYDGARRRVVIDPRSKLRSSATYRVRITSAVRDLTGHRLDQNPTRAGRQDAIWTFRTR